MIEYSSDLHSLDDKEWEGFILRHPRGHVFQGPGFCRAMNKTAGRECLGSFARRGDALVGVNIAVVQREIPGPLGSLASRAIIHGGPVVENDDPEIAEGLIALTADTTANKAVYTQVRNLYNVGAYDSAFRASRFIFEKHLNILVNLEKPEDTLWREVHTKRRNEIRRAIREGTRFTEASTLGTLGSTYKILRGVYRKAKLPLPDVRYFEACFSELGPHVFRIFTAMLGEKIIGAMYALCFKDVIYNWYAGADRDYLHKYPNDLIPWEVFRWGKSNGFRRFDFGGAGRPEIPYGVRDYKKKFGGDFVSYGRYERINKLLAWHIARAGFRAWRFLRSMMRGQD